MRNVDEWETWIAGILIGLLSALLVVFSWIVFTAIWAVVATVALVVFMILTVIRWLRLIRAKERLNRREGRWN